MVAQKNERKVSYDMTSSKLNSTYPKYILLLFIIICFHGFVALANGRRCYAIDPGVLGAHNFEATATDAAGNVGTAANLLLIVDPSDTTPPIVEIETPTDDSEITTFTDIIATVQDENLV